MSTLLERRRATARAKATLARTAHIGKKPMPIIRRDFSDSSRAREQSAKLDLINMELDKIAIEVDRHTQNLHRRG